ncbi:MAG: undecaprenyl/decaprenyl-phosphate alpha-N-acetylglucosaminyl 1-phosphate transferase [Deltaproteobacteria bacterium]|nr:undecaprenyl/decaprenyl-phosphate alpha-N-acetylglucosaminyl 1-phosphate transferase [Deltaproteobacteria bacterium]
MTPLAIVIPLLVAFVVSFLATPGVSRIARALEVIDRPNERKVSRRENIPLLGGLAVALGFFVGIAIAVSFFTEGDPYRGHLEGLLLGGLLILSVGAFDDRYTLGPKTKLAVQVLAAAIAVYYGFEIRHLTDPVTRTAWLMPSWLMTIVTMVWIVGITNALNLLDGLDGLCTGVAAIIGATLTIICWQASQALGVAVGVSFVGALLGFLPHNFSPARIFLGDTGALFIGYVLSLLAIEGYRQGSVLTFIVPLLALAVPIMDVGLSVLRRLRRHSAVMQADRSHIHHRLLESEGSHRAAVLSLYFLTACFCVIALSFTRLQGYVAIGFLAAVLALTFRLLRNLGFFAESPATTSPEPQGSAGSERR